MCIIVYKPKDHVISEDILDNCWNTNKDGAGIAVVEKKNTTVIKGIMSKKELMKLKKYINRNEVVIHFRYATHGLKNESNTHPFVVSNNVDDLKRVCYNTSSPVIAHNGVIPNVQRCSTISDTMEFILSNHDNIHKACKVESDSNKFAVIEQGKVHLYGKWIYDNGIYYSNDGYEEKFHWYYSPKSKQGKLWNYLNNSDDYFSEEVNDDCEYGICETCGDIVEDCYCNTCGTFVEGEDKYGQIL